MTEEKREFIKAAFKRLDNQRLLYGPDDYQAMFLHGMMAGIREKLELEGIEIDGVTGLWWYEELKGVREVGLEELKEKYGDRGKYKHIFIGAKKGVQWVEEILDFSYSLL